MCFLSRLDDYLCKNEKIFFSLIYDELKYFKVSFEMKVIHICYNFSLRVLTTLIAYNTMGQLNTFVIHSFFSMLLLFSFIFHQ